LKIKQRVAGLDLEHSKLFIFSYLCKVIKKIERRFSKNFARSYEKKWKLEQLAWSIRRSSMDPMTQCIILNIVGLYLAVRGPWHISGPSYIESALALECTHLYEVKVNLCQKLSFLHQLTHNMTTHCSLNYKCNK
jgi:hypothetical protein